jgi:hypothetical protein
VLLPTKHLSADQALITWGARVLTLLAREPKTVTRTWDEVRTSLATPISYDWFILTLDMLAAIDAIRFERGKLHRRQ